MFNYNHFAKQYNNKESAPCYSSDVKHQNFVNQSHIHIITGDLNIVENLKL